MFKKCYQSILDVQNGNKERLLELVNQFKPLLNKYSRKSGYEDAFCDMQLSFIELIYHFPIYNFSENDEIRILSYISRSMYHTSIALSKKEWKNRENILFSELEEEETYRMEESLKKEDEYNFTEIDFLQDILSSREYQIIKGYFYEGKLEKELAEEYHLSKAAISKIKQRGLAKIKKVYLA